MAARRKGNTKAGLAGVAVVTVLCCGGLVALGNLAGDPEPARTVPPAPVVERVVPTTPAVTAEPEPVEIVEEPEEEDDEPRRGVTAGAFCDTRGAVGFTKTGRRMVCKGPEPLRWRRP